MKFKDHDRVLVTLLILGFIVEPTELKAVFYQTKIYYKVFPYFYINENNSIEMRVFISFILRELFKNRKDYIMSFVND